MNSYERLLTSEGETLLEPVWDVYPRPQMRRESFLCLNGVWDFSVCADANPPETFTQTILVPFAPESILSGVEERIPERSTIWYRKRFSLPAGFQNDRVLLNIGAVDQEAEVFVNGISVGTHSGGYEAFTLDITDALQEENVLTVKVTDRLDKKVMPYGKQRHKNGGMWYTPVSGIWQTVWLESVPREYIRAISIETGLEQAEIRVDGVETGTVTVQTPDGTETVELCGGKAVIRPKTVRNWSPEYPYLYQFTVETEEDRIESYFALRTLEIRSVNGIARMCLNGEPYFFHGLLDQGYWSDGIFTPAVPECYTQEILQMKALGFNMLRKHIKVEPEVFYYDCDRLGMVIFQDMVNNGSYSFLRDTALPTIGLQTLNDRILHRDPKTRSEFIRGMEATVRQLRNHPCICCWTIFNEGWGQFCGSEQYRRLKALDSSRFIDTASGWFAGCETDLDSKHVYFRKVNLCAGDKPLFLSEFGGYSWRPEGHIFNKEKNYGYGNFRTREEFVQGLRRLYSEEILPLVAKGLCATVYTQVSDVEEETNGLLSYDRHVQKVFPGEFRDISEQLIRAIKS